MSDNIQSMRHDMTEWVVHFVHRRNPRNNPPNFLAVNSDSSSFPYTTDKARNKAYEEYCYWEDECSLEGDAYAIQILLKILKDGYIKTSWSFRNDKATIYGPRSAACFTEMPLSSLLTYAKTRNDESVVDVLGIALRKSEFFQAGGRPVIYGLSGKHLEDFNRGWPRFLNPECGIGHDEQYRYVSFNLDNEARPIDWTHEREWRWTDRLAQCSCPGLPIWLNPETHWFSTAMIIVADDNDAQRVLNKLKELYDARENNGIEYRSDLLKTTRVISLESIQRESKSLEKPLRIEDIPTQQLSSFKHPTPSAKMISQVQIALSEARETAHIAATNWKALHGDGLGPCGFAWIEVENAQSEFVETLIQLKEIKAYGGFGYRLENITDGICTMALDHEKAAVEAAKTVLERHFPEISFWINTRWD